MIEQRLRRGRLDGVRVKGAPYPPVPPGKKRDRQPRPRFPVKRTGRPRPLHEPSSHAVIAKAGGRDPNGNRDPVVFHGYHPSKGLTKSLTNAADMSGSDSKRDVVMMSGNWYCDVSNDGGANWKRLDPTTIFPEDPRRRLLLRPGRRLRAPHRPLHLVPAVRRRRSRPGGVPDRLGVVGLGQERPDRVDLLGLRRGQLRLPDEGHGLPGSRLLDDVPLRQHRRLRVRRPASC